MSSVAVARAEVFRPKTEDTLGLGMVLALAAHLLLVLALAFGVSWRTNTPVIAEAEIWSEVPTAAAPTEAPPPPPPTPVEETPPPPPPVAQVEPEPAPEPEADIPSAPVPKAKRKKEKPLPPVAKVEPPPKPKKKPPEPKETFINEPVVAKKPKTPPAPPATPATPTVSAAEREAQRKSALQRMMKDLGSLGTSERSAGPTASGNYKGKIRARIIPNITFLMDEGSSNPTAWVQIRVAPDGTILSSRLMDSSGSAGWDKAVLDGIDKTRSLPLDEKGRIPDSVFEIGISPRDR